MKKKYLIMNEAFFEHNHNNAEESSLDNAIEEAVGTAKEDNVTVYIFELKKVIKPLEIPVDVMSVEKYEYKENDG